MGAFSRKPVSRIMLVATAALLAVLALSACLARSNPTPPPPTPVAANAQPTVAPGPTLGAAKPAEPAKPTARPDGLDLAVSAWRKEAVAAGAKVTYRVGYENGDLKRAAGDVVLKVSLPEGASLVTSSRGQQAFPPRATGNALEYPLGTLKPAEHGEINLTVQMPGKLVLGSRLALTARIAGSAPDPDEENNYAEDAVEVAAPRLTVAVRPADKSGPFVPGHAASYLLSYANASAVEAGSVVVTATLSAEMAFHSAAKVSMGSQAAITPKVEGSHLSFDLGTLGPHAAGDILMEVGLANDVRAGQPLTLTAGIAAAPGEVDLQDNQAENVQQAQEEGPDVWVKLEKQSDGELGAAYTYQVGYGNRGTEDAADVVISLAIPSALKDVTFSSAPTTFSGGTATWKVGKLGAATPKSITAKAVIGGTGQAMARAAAATAGKDADPRNNTAELADDLVALRMPTITGPSDALVGAQPVFFGQGKPKATISLYLAGTESQPGRLLGSSLVDQSGRWEISPTAKLELPGWYWFTATQQLGTLVSPATGVANYYDDKLTIDSNSLTVNGQRVGGIDQAIEWPAHRQLTFGARIITCGSPLTPTLQARYYNTQGVMVNHQKIAPKLTRPDGYVEFDFQVPGAEQKVEWELELGFYCREQLQTSRVGRSPGLAKQLGDWTDIFNPDCWFGNCKKDPPPPPPPKCPGCTPLPKPKPRPRPEPDDDDKTPLPPLPTAAPRRAAR